MSIKTQNNLSLVTRLRNYFYRKKDAEKIIRDRYLRTFGKVLDTENPKLFSEKLFLRMILGNSGCYTEFANLADKYRVRGFVKNKIGEEFLPKLLWSGTDPESIPFDLMPEKYVIKTNHGCGGNIIVRNDVNRIETVKKLQHWLGENYYWDDREFQYYTIKPRIVIEELLDDGIKNGPLDYRFWCFDGKPVVIQVDDHCHEINNFYDNDWNSLELSYRDKAIEADIERPPKLDRMIELASRLSSGFDFVRVDLYNIHGRIYFGELTFTPVAGRLKFKPDSWDVKLGNLWQLRKY